MSGLEGRNLNTSLPLTDNQKAKDKQIKQEAIKRAAAAQAKVEEQFKAIASSVQGA